MVTMTTSPSTLNPSSRGGIWYWLLLLHIYIRERLRSWSPPSVKNGSEDRHDHAPPPPVLFRSRLGIVGMGMAIVTYSLLLEEMANSDGHVHPPSMVMPRFSLLQRERRDATICGWVLCDHDHLPSTTPLPESWIR